MKKFLPSLFVILSLQVFSQVDEKVPYGYSVSYDEAYAQNPQIPRGILEAVAYTNTRMYHVPADEPESCTGMPRAYGVMGLIADGKGWFKSNMVSISQLSGYSAKDIIDNPHINIKAYAKAYCIIKNNRGIAGNDIESQIPVLQELSELPLIKNDAGSDYALNSFLYSLLTFLNNKEFGIQYNFPEYNIDLVKVFGENNLKILSAPKVQVSNTGVVNENGDIYEIKGLKTACPDYPFANCSWVASPNYNSRSGATISAIAIHTVQGSYAGCISWFQNSSASASTHYVVRSSDGQLTQMVLESDKAWHVTSENPYSIGYEHEGYMDQPTWYTQAMYQSSANLTIDICAAWSINPNRVFFRDTLDDGTALDYGVHNLGGEATCVKVKGHQHFANQSHTDPGPNWSWDYYFKLINNGTPVTTFTATAGNFYDTGGSMSNYGDDERKLWLIAPPGASSVTLVFSSFTVEANYDFMYIYNGDNVFAPLIGRYNTTSPGSVTAGSGKMLIEFRSDCSTSAMGWTASWSTPIAPFIITDPANQQACTGSTATLTVSSGGSTPLYYQWKKEGADIAGATNSFYLIDTVTADDAGSYTCYIYNLYGSVTSSSAILTVNTAPVITVQPESQTVCDGNSALFTLAATGSSLTYQWKKEGNEIPDSTANSFSINSVSAVDEGSYTCFVSNSCGIAASNAATLLINSTPIIAIQPVDQTVCEGASAVYFVSATGGNLSYLWMKNGINISDANDSAYTLDPVLTGDAGNYSCFINNSCGNATSDTVILGVNTPPVISSNPANQIVCTGGDVSFSVSATGTSPLLYQWNKNGEVITDATDSVFFISNAGLANTGDYTCEISNICGTILSSAATLTINSPAGISVQPVDQSVCLSGNVSFSVAVTGQSPFFYQWKKDGMDISGANTNILNLNNINYSDTGNYSCQIGSVCDTLISESAILAVYAPPAALVTYGGSTVFCDGDSLILYSNTGSYTYQWLLNGNVISGAIQSYYAAKEAGFYTVIITNTHGCSDTSSLVTITVNSTDFNLTISTIPDPPHFTSPNAGNDFNVLFHNETPGASNYSFTIYYGDGEYSNVVNEDHYYHFNGWYSVTLIAQNNSTGCVDTLSLVDEIGCAGGIYNPCSITAGISPSGALTICNGDSILLTANTGTGFTYEWTHNGTIINDATGSVYYAKLPGEYRVIIHNLSCAASSFPVVVSFYNSIEPVILSEGSISPCTGDSMELYVTTWFNSYLWSTGQTTQNIFVSATGNYVATVTDIYGCSAISEPYVVNASLLPAPEICLVTIDTTSGKNLVVWEKILNGATLQYNVYKQTTVANVYEQIGSVPYSALSQFTDTASHPDQQADYYKLSVVDTCNNESSLSAHHKTIHLTISDAGAGGYNLIWNHYEGFAYGTYFIYRGSSLTDMTPVHQMASNLNSWTDNQSTISYYKIEIQKDDTCYTNLSKTQTGPYSQSVSNIDDNSIWVGTNRQYFANENVRVYPNPFNKSATIVFPNPEDKKYQLIITDVAGKVARIYKNVTTDRLVIEKGELMAGVYFVEVKGENTYIGKLIVE